MHCIICKAGPHDDVPVYRINKKRIPGKWACEKHVKLFKTDLDPHVVALIKVISGGNNDQKWYFTRSKIY